MLTQQTTEALEIASDSGPPRHSQELRASTTVKANGWFWFVLLLLIAGVAGFAVWRTSRPAGVERAQASGNGRSGRGGRGGALGTIPVVVANATRSVVPVYLNGLGNVAAFYTVTVKSRVDGQLMKVDFNEGDTVTAGQVLIEIDPRPFQVQLELAQATLAHDQAVLNNAKVDVERYVLLRKTEAIPKQQLDTQVALVAQYEATIQQ